MNRFKPGDKVMVDTSYATNIDLLKNTNKVFTVAKVLEGINSLILEESVSEDYNNRTQWNYRAFKFMPAELKELTKSDLNQALDILDI